MATYLVRRILLMVPTLLGITAIVFFTMKAAPGDVAEMLINREGQMQPGDRAARVAYIKDRYGLGDPWFVQYLRWMHKISPVGVWQESSDTRGWGWRLGGAGSGDSRRFGLKIPDFGSSFVKNRPVLDLIREALPVTLLLNVISIPIIYSVAIVTGVYAARHRGRFFDVSSGVVMLALWSVPSIWAGVLLIVFLANTQYLQLFPTAGLHAVDSGAMSFLPRWHGGDFEPGWLLDTAWHLCLPIICLSYGGFAFLAKLSRGAVLENLQADFVRTARAKGVNETDLLWQHAFRNSLLPLITVAAYVLPGMLAGSLIVEVIFSVPGMGKLMIESIKFKDQEVVMAVTVISGVLTVIAYLAADIFYAVADPRVSYE